jgi:hypothetical protein
MSFKRGKYRLQNLVFDDARSTIELRKKEPGRKAARRGADKGGETMELITNWEVLNAASLGFCQFQGLLGILIISGIVIFKHNLGEKLAPFK